jgi:hypothetical protein
MTTFGICAVLAGAIADLATPRSTITAFAVMSLLVSLALTRPLTRVATRTVPVPPAEVSGQSIRAE